MCPLEADLTDCMCMMHILQKMVLFSHNAVDMI